MSDTEDLSTNQKLEILASTLEATLNKVEDVEKRLQNVEREMPTYKISKQQVGDTEASKERSPSLPTPRKYAVHTAPINITPKHQQKATFQGLASHEMLAHYGQVSGEGTSKAGSPPPPTPSDYAVHIYRDSTPTHIISPQHQQRAALQGLVSHEHKVEHVYEMEISMTDRFRTGGQAIYEMPDDPDLVTSEQRQQSYVGTDPPPDYQNLAAFVLFFCFCPLGLWAFIKSEEVKTLHVSGLVNESRRASKLTLYLSLIGLCIGLTTILVGAAAALGFL